MQQRDSISTHPFTRAKGTVKFSKFTTITRFFALNSHTPGNEAQLVKYSSLNSMQSDIINTSTPNEYKKPRYALYEDKLFIFHLHQLCTFGSLEI